MSEVIDDVFRYMQKAEYLRNLLAKFEWSGHARGQGSGRWVVAVTATATRRVHCAEVSIRQARVSLRNRRSGIARIVSCSSPSTEARMSGKGDTRRPASICGTEYDARWERTFGKDSSTKHETRTVPCDRCNGTGVVWDTDLERPTVQTSRTCPSCQGATHVQENVE